MHIIVRSNVKQSVSKKLEIGTKITFSTLHLGAGADDSHFDGHQTLISSSVPLCPPAGKRENHKPAYFQFCCHDSSLSPLLSPSINLPF